MMDDEELCHQAMDAQVAQLERGLDPHTSRWYDIEPDRKIEAQNSPGKHEQRSGAGWF